jgi:hypothetical protein
MLCSHNKAIVNITVLWDGTPYISVDTETGASASSALNVKAACSPTNQTVRRHILNTATWLFTATRRSSLSETASDKDGRKGQDFTPRNWAQTGSVFTSYSLGKRYRNPITGLDRPWGSQEAEVPRFHDNRHMKVLRSSALCTGRLYNSQNIPGNHSR